MPEKNIRIQEWLKEFNRLVDRSIAELRGIKVKARRVRERKAKVKWYSFPTQVRRPSTSWSSMSNSTSKKIEGYIKSTRWKRRAEQVPRKLEREEQTRKAKPSAESRSVRGTL